MKRSGVLMPAVWMSACGVPAFSTVSIAEATLAPSATSQTTGMMFGESAALSWSDSSVRPNTNVFAPASAKRFAAACPIPPPPPVTITILSVQF
jgi:hypothetical protein